MGQALYRKYRSKSLSELVGQEHIVTALHNAIEKGIVSHAYLFTGPRGVGKTSTARILAYAVNGLPYAKDATHLDIIEIDAASNRRIEEIRDLRERVHIAPTSAKYKVYIIDEVHMLTKEAFNALLKTLEEPPAHVIFILATTEAHKLPETIVSRTQRYTFRPVDEQVVVGHLRTIADAENISIDDDALALIARHGDGSFRDSISLLDQVRTIGGNIETQHVNQLLGIAPSEAIATLWQTLESRSSAQVLECLQSMRLNGYEAGQLARQLSELFRKQLIAGYSNPARLLKALQLLLEVPASHDADTALELALLSIAFEAGTANPPVQPVPITKPITPSPPAATIDPPIIQVVSEQPAPKSVDTVIEPATVSISNIPVGPELWASVLDLLKEKYKTLYTVMRMAEAEFGNDALTIYFKFPFHMRRINEPKNKQILLDALRSSAGGDVNLMLAVRESTDTSIAPPATQKTPIPQAEPDAAPNRAPESITAVFGGGEVLDS